MDISSQRNFISSKEASLLTGYVADYITRLCRQGKIPSRQDGRAWLIDRDLLLAFVEEERVRKEKMARELALAREAEYRAAKAAREVIPSPYAPIPASLVWHEEDSIPYTPLPGSFAALAVTLAVLAGGLYLGTNEARDAASVSAAWTLDTSVRVASHILEPGRTSEDVRVASVVAAPVTRAWSAPRLPVAVFGPIDTASTSVRILKQTSGESVPSVVALSGMGHALALLGGHIVSVSNAILAMHERAVTSYANEAPQIPRRVIAAVYGLGLTTSSIANETPQAAIAYALSLENVALGVVGNVALAYDTARETLSSAYAYAPAMKVARVAPLENLAREPELPAAGPEDPYIKEVPSAPELASVYGALEDAALFTFDAINGLFATAGNAVTYLLAPQPAGEPARPIVITSTGPVRLSDATTGSNTPSVTYVTNAAAGLTNEDVSRLIESYLGAYATTADEKLAELETRLEEEIDDVDDTEGTVTSINGSGGGTGLTLTGGPIKKAGYLTLGGILDPESGGTGTSTAPSYGQLLIGNALGRYDLVATSSLGIAGGSSLPGGSTTQVQFNSAGAFSGDAGFTYDAAGNILAVASGVIQSTSGIFRGDDEYHQIILHNGGNSTDYFEWGDTLAANGGHRFYTGGPGFTLRAQIADDGAYFAGPLGVGTLAPQAALDVRDEIFVRNVDGVVGSNDGVEIATDASAPRVSLVQGGRYVGLFSGDAPGNTYLKNVAGGALLFYGGSGGNEELARLTNSGYLGIGTTSPYARLSVVGPVVAEYFHATSTTGTSIIGGTLKLPLLGTPAGSFLAIDANGGVIATTTPGGSSLTGTTGQVAYFSGSNTAVGTSSLFIAASGKVGIGTTNPNSNLDVQTNVSGNQSLLTLSSGNIWSTYPGTGNQAGIEWKDSSGTVGTIGVAYNASSNTTDITFGSLYNGSYPSAWTNPVITVKGNGKLGIGTTSPYADLSIHANNGDTNTTLFAIGSSTASATTTLFAVSNTGQVLAADGTGALPAFSFVNESTLGIYRKSNNVMQIGRSAAPTFDIVTSGGTPGIRMSSGTAFWWNSNSGNTGTDDTGLRRISAGVVGIGNTAIGNITGTLALERIGLGTSTPYAQLAIVATSTNGVGAPTTLFAIASTTTGTATSTLLSFSNAGQLSIANTNDGNFRAISLAGASSGLTGIISSTQFRTMGLAFGYNFSDSMGIAVGDSSFNNAGAGISQSNVVFSGSGSTGVRWTSSTLQSSYDTGISRAAAGVVRIGNGSANAFGTLTTERIGLGTTTPYAQLSIVATSTNGLGAPATLFAIASTTTGTATTTLFVVNNKGNVGIGSTSPWTTLSVAGTMAAPGLVNDSTGYYVCLNTTSGQLATSTTACGASSLRFKENVEGITYGLDAVMELNAVSFDYKDKYLKDAPKQLGFIAEEVDLVIPELVARDAHGVIQGLDYPKFVAVIVKAIQDLVNIQGKFREALIAWMGDATNDLASVFVGSLEAKEKICVDGECLTKEDVRALLELVGRSSSHDANAGGSEEPPAEESPTEDPSSEEPPADGSPAEETSTEEANEEPSVEESTPDAPENG